jgi:hypothetical protein
MASQFIIACRRPIIFSLAVFSIRFLALHDQHEDSVMWHILQHGLQGHDLDGRSPKVGIHVLYVACGFLTNFRDGISSAVAFDTISFRT